MTKADRVASGRRWGSSRRPFCPSRSRVGELRMPAPRVTISRAMIAVAAIAVSLAALRFHLSLGSFVACVLCLGMGRAFAVSERLRGEGRPLSGADEAILF